MWNAGNEVKAGEIKGERLAHYHFNDLYISTDRTVAPIARRLVLTGVDQRVINGVHPVPRMVLPDLEGLRKAIHDASMERGYFEREIQIVYDEVAYRGALIAEPDAPGTNPYEAKAPEFQTWCLRRIGNAPPKLSELKLPNFLYKVLKESVTNRGLVLISGSFGSGKTTTSAACLQTWVEDANEVGITLEDPPEFPLAVPEGKGMIYQINVSDRDPAEAIKHMRRHAPRFVFLGEIRTPETARELLHMSASGPLVLCTIHASDPIQALTSLILFASSAMEPDMARQLAARCISLIVHQEMSNGIVQAKLLEIKDDDFGIQSKIRTGRYDLIYEDFETQRIRRNNPGGFSSMGKAKR
ncbi:ATPase, T2SS/T4P/T4SS family [Sulfitobacter sp. 1A13353]|uniref:ATPase, T2SS/T4P/T4SS family n=1 Tax=Sulfitobacter sp. 1A13353 TaxID=3368568 RepID=UPI003744FF08